MHKISILWHSGLLDMFLHRSLKTVLKNTRNSPLYNILKLTFQEIFKNENFCFSQFSQNSIFKKIFILWHREFLDMFLYRSPKTALKNTQNQLSLQHFEVNIPGDFQKGKFSFFPIFSNFFFWLMLGLLRSPYKLLRLFEISW